MPFLPQILELMKRRDYIPLPVERIAEALEIAPDDFEDFRNEVLQHMRQGTLVKLKKNRLCLPRDADLVTGKLRFRQSGAALLFPEGIEVGATPQPPILIRSEDTGVSLHGDRVVARMNQERSKHRRTHDDRKRRVEEPTARVIRILKRANETITGTLRRSKSYYYVIPGDPRIIQDILVPDPSESSLKPIPEIDDKVIVKLDPWEQRHLNPEGEIIEVLGKTHNPGAEYKALLHQYKLDPSFPEDVIRDVRSIPEKVPEKALTHRIDHRDVYTFTIDPQDAKDFDDALSVETLKNGNFRIGVHIADVSAYVCAGTALDREAYERGNSTYLVGRVIPMLPHELSNGICSLVEDEDRLTKTAFLEYTSSGELIETSFANTVIRSNKRLTYEQAYSLLKNDDLEETRALPLPPKHQTGSTGRALSDLKSSELTQLQKEIRLLWKIASQLRKSRMHSGSLDLDMPETKIYVNPEGYADKIVKISHDESHQLIEEFMLAANEGVAAALNERRQPAIHRVHDEPDPQKLGDLSEYMQTAGIHAGDLTQPRKMGALLREIKKHDQSYTLRIMVLRSLKQAQYRASPDGHYGLGKRNYLHFTSPIRRYADLVVHRVFDRFLISEAQAAPIKHETYDVARLHAVAQHISLTEQNSTEAERESTKLKLLEFFERELDKEPKDTFDAVIMDIRNHGMFVELKESMAYGMIHISTLDDDLYHLSDGGEALVGRKTRRTFRLGETIKASIGRVDRFKRQIDFIVAGTGSSKSRPRGKKPFKPLPAKKAGKSRKPGKGKKDRGKKRPARKEAVKQPTESPKSNRRPRSRSRGKKRPSTD
jgi:ribonuclease R|tara:strand:- start:119 stop:2596 length:2478 start_codon:yes stop_codon:yes gene_type:complete